MRLISNVIFLLFFTTGAMAQGYTHWVTGDTSDISVTGVQAGVVLAGGGGDSDAAMSWMLERAAGGDVLVLRASGSDGYNNYFYSGLGVTVNSVETIRFDNAAAASDPYVLRRIAEAEVLFFAGGDQYDYYLYFKDNAVEDAIRALIHEKGITVGGTSAGMAILGEAYYTPSSLGVYSSEALADPFHPYMDILGYGDFLDVPYLEKTVTDTHFEQRDRQGRFTTFLARLVNDYGFRAKGIAANEYTAVCVDENGQARCFGEYPDFPEDVVFFAQANCEAPIGPEICEADTPLHWQRNEEAVKVYRIPATANGDNTFDLTDWMTGMGGMWEDWYVDNGEWKRNDDAQEPDCGAYSSLTELSSPELRIFPNPLSGEELTIEWQGPAILELALLDARGQVCQQFSVADRRLRLNRLATGMYWLRIQTNVGTIVRPVQLIR